MLAFSSGQTLPLGKLGSSLGHMEKKGVVQNIPNRGAKVIKNYQRGAKFFNDEVIKLKKGISFFHEKNILGKNKSITSNVSCFYGRGMGAIWLGTGGLRWGQCSCPQNVQLVPPKPKSNTVKKPTRLFNNKNSEFRKFLTSNC